MGTAKRDRQRANRQARLEAAIEAQRKRSTRKRVLRVGAIVIVGLVAALAISLWSGGDDSEPVATGDASTTTAAGDSTTDTTAASGGPFAYGTGECPAADAPVTKTFTAAPKLCIDPAKTYTATFTTTAGTIKAALDTSRTPGTTNNFVTLARYHYYDGSLFFRTDPSIGIIQGGGQTNTDSPGYTIPDEGGRFTYSPGDLVMARSGAPNSGGAQFFFAVNDATSSLDSQGTYVTFGKVTEGMDVLGKVLASHKAQEGNALGGAPDPAVTVTSVTIEES
jgi:cyclophilin family peptidyl-prolyl cis-trans isomerase